MGSDKDIDVDVRVIAATNKNLREEIAKGNFREDLYHRIGVIVVRVPPLREHAQDIPLLVDHFIHTICAEYHIPAKRIEEEALSELQTMPWSGNIRELRNVNAKRLIILSEERITPADVQGLLLTEAQNSTPTFSRRGAVAELLGKFGGEPAAFVFRSRSSRCNS